MSTTPQHTTTTLPPVLTPVRTTLFLALELGGNHWDLGFAVEPAGKLRRRRLRSGQGGKALLELVRAEILAAKQKFGLPADAPVLSVYEAGREAFWLHHGLAAMGVENVVVDAASLPVDRRSRQVKTDRLDLKKLLACLFQHARGEKVWKVVRVPDPAVEDARRLTRRRERLVKEHTQHCNRIKSLLNQEGIKQVKITRSFEARLETMRRFDGRPLGKRLLDDLRDELARLRLVQEQLQRIKAEQRDLLQQENPTCPVVRRAQALARLKGIGPVIGFAFSAEFFAWRNFKNRKQVGGLAGLGDAPWKSDGIDRQQGITKAGNRRVRTLAIELAWIWLRWQPQSELSRWFRERRAPGKRQRRVGIVALARKLLVALWRYLDHNENPAGAVFS